MNSIENKQYELIVCGGTFDQFHKGHQTFLQYALQRGKKVLLGLTSDKYIKEIKHVTYVQPYEERKQQLTEYLSSLHALHRVEIAPIDNSGIPDVWASLSIEAILVTPDSFVGAQAINYQREQNHKPALIILELPLTLAEDGLPISATRIRKGEISPEGKLFVRPEWMSQTFLLPESLRSSLQEPFGKIIDAKTADFSFIDWHKAVSVGDVTTLLLHNRGVVPALCIIDFVVKRKVTYSTLLQLGFLGNEQVVEVENPAGQVTSALCKAVQNFFSNEQREKETVIRVKGEEDLAVLPVILLAPLGFDVFYGQPGVGTVHLQITRERKEHAFSLLKEFTIR